MSFAEEQEQEKTSVNQVQAISASPVVRKWNDSASRSGLTIPIAIAHHAPDWLYRSIKISRITKIIVTRQIKAKDTLISNY